MILLLCGIAIGSVVGFLVYAFIAGSAQQEQSASAFGNELDAQRLDFLSEEKPDVLYNVEHQGWGVVSRDSKFVYAAGTLRAAIDGARHKPSAS